jgi:hypothetical protein
MLYRGGVEDVGHRVIGKHGRFLEEFDVRERAFEVCIGLGTGRRDGGHGHRQVFCMMLCMQTLQIAF